MYTGNILNINYHISEYVHLIDNLRSEIKILKDQISIQPTTNTNNNSNIHSSSGSNILYNTQYNNTNSYTSSGNGHGPKTENLGHEPGNTVNNNIGNNNILIII